ncbi:hypothetical protein IJT10_01815 [bacterium]|nr:hypothetical protein [bacterium]
MSSAVKIPIVYLSHPELLGRIRLEIVSPPNQDVLPWLPMPKIDAAAIEAKVKMEEDKANQKAKRMESFNSPVSRSAPANKNVAPAEEKKVGLGLTSSKPLIDRPTAGDVPAPRQFRVASGGRHRSVEREEEGERRSAPRRARRGNHEIDLSRLQQNIFGN